MQCRIYFTGDCRSSITYTVEFMEQKGIAGQSRNTCMFSSIAIARGLDRRAAQTQSGITRCESDMNTVYLYNFHVDICFITKNCLTFINEGIFQIALT